MTWLPVFHDSTEEHDYLSSCSFISLTKLHSKEWTISDDIGCISFSDSRIILSDADIQFNLVYYMHDNAPRGLPIWHDSTDGIVLFIV